MLSGKSALITGAARGIGLEFARAYLDQARASPSATSTWTPPVTRPRAWVTAPSPSRWT